MTVQPNADYVLSGWIKANNVAHSLDAVDAGANLSILGGFTRTAPIFGTTDWTFANVRFNSGSARSVTVAARVGMYAGTTTGTAWLDDINLAPVAGPAPGLASVLPFSGGTVGGKS